MAILSIKEMLTKYKSFNNQQEMMPIQKIQSTDNPNASKNKRQKYVALIMIDSSDLYPLTRDYPIALLPIGNKKMILYQLESLIKLGRQTVEKVYIAFNQINKGVDTFILKQFLPQHPNFPLQIKFIKLQQEQSNYLSFQESLQFLSNKTEFQNLILLPCDTISSIGLQKLVDLHQDKKSDCTMLLRTKKQSTETDKKQTQENQSEIDLALIGVSGEVLSLDTIGDYTYSGFKVHSSIMRRVTRSAVSKVIDSRIYVFSRRVVKIACQLDTGELNKVKPDFIGTLVKNQTNLRLLNLISANIDSSKSNMKKKGIANELQGSKIADPLNIYTILAEPDQYIKRISSLKIYADINADSLTRGSKQKQVLVPTEYTTKTDQVHNLSKTQSILGRNASIGEGNQIRRTIIDENCEIGKNVKIANSVIMRGVQIMDGCKITDCIIGPNVKIGENSVVKSCYFAKNSRLKDGEKRDSQPIITQ